MGSFSCCFWRVVCTCQRCRAVLIVVSYDLDKGKNKNARNSYLSAMIRSKKIVARRREQEEFARQLMRKSGVGEFSSDRANLQDRFIPSGVFLNSSGLLLESRVTL